MEKSFGSRKTMKNFKKYKKCQKLKIVENSEFFKTKVK